MKNMKKNEDGYFVINRHNQYVKGVIGQDIKLSFIDKIKILFSKGIAVHLIEPRRS